MKSKKVYIITAGEYSDYGIKTVFLDPKEAQAYCDAHNNLRESSYDKFGVEEWDVNTASYIVGVHEITIWHAQYAPWKSKLDPPQDPYYTWEEKVLNTEFDIFKEYKPSPSPAQILTLKESEEVEFDDITFNTCSDYDEAHALRRLHDYVAKMKALWEDV
jgi:hypothetical protein